jgi:hypothetical protein
VAQAMRDNAQQMEAAVERQRRAYGYTPSYGSYPPPVI